MIPKIIHQTWKNNTIPENTRRYVDTLRTLHPEWEYKLWIDEENAHFVKTYYPQFIEAYENFPKNIMRADIIRYLILHKHGGLYLDLDYEMLKRFDLVHHELVLPYNRNKANGDKHDAIGNCILASVRDHQFWSLVMEDFKRVRNYQAAYKSLSKLPFNTIRTTMEEAITGPGHLTKVFFEYKDRLEAIHTPGRHLFHPKLPLSQRQYNKIIDKGEAYGIHHSFGTWRNRSFLNKMKKGLMILIKGD